MYSHSNFFLVWCSPKAEKLCYIGEGFKRKSSIQSSFWGPDFHLECARFHQVRMTKGANYCLFPDLSSWVSFCIFLLQYNITIIFSANKGIYQEIRCYFLKRKGIFLPNLLIFMSKGYSRCDSWWGKEHRAGLIRYLRI